jgi:hypothetical protein
VDPKTGQTLGINERGWGGDLTEESILLKYTNPIARTFAGFDACVIAVYLSGDYWPESMPTTGWIKCASYGLGAGLAFTGYKILIAIGVILAGVGTGIQVK